MSNVALTQRLECELDIVERRLIKSGPGHYAKARFDAVVFVVVDQIPRYSDVVDEEALRSLRTRTEQLIAAYPELDAPSAGRNAKNAHRTGMLIDAILSEVGLRRRGDPDHSMYVSRYASPQSERVQGLAEDEVEIITLKTRESPGAPRSTKGE